MGLELYFIVNIGWDFRVLGIDSADGANWSQSVSTAFLVTQDSGLGATANNGQLVIASNGFIGQQMLSGMDIQTSSTFGKFYQLAPLNVELYSVALVSFREMFFGVGLNDQTGISSISSYDGQTWSAATPLEGFDKVRTTPSLAVHGGKLFLVFQDYQSNLLISSSLDGVAWTVPVGVEHRHRQPPRWHPSPVSCVSCLSVTVQPEN